MTYDPSIHHRKSIRLKEYDYAESGMYFFTVCCHDKKALLGHISEGEIELNRFGEIVHEVWLDLPKHYAQIKLDEFVVMPNHIHGILVINPPAGESGAKKHTLSEIIRALKTFSARQINALRSLAGVPVWQRNYYEHIIRDESSYTTIAEYIQTNPMQWEKDDYHV